MFIIPSEEKQSRPYWSYCGPNPLLMKWLYNICDGTLVIPCIALSDSFDAMNPPPEEIPYPVYGGSPDCSSSSSLLLGHWLTVKPVSQSLSEMTGPCFHCSTEAVRTEHHFYSSKQPKIFLPCPGSWSNLSWQSMTGLMEGCRQQEGGQPFSAASFREKVFSKLVLAYLLQERQRRSYVVLRFQVLWNVLALQMTPSQREELQEGWPFIHVLKGDKNFMAFSESKHKILSFWEGKTHCSVAELLFPPSEYSVW